MSRPDPALLRIGDLIHTGVKGWALFPVSDFSVGRVIQSLTGSDVNHTMVVQTVGPTVGTTYVVEAHYPSVRHVPLSDAIGRWGERWYVCRHREPISNEGYLAIRRFLNEQIGEVYDVALIAQMRAALAQGGVEALRALRVEMLNDGIDHADYWICSELGAHALTMAGVPGFENYDPHAALQSVYVPTPGELRDSSLYRIIAKG